MGLYMLLPPAIYVTHHVFFHFNMTDCTKYYDSCGLLGKLPPACMNHDCKPGAQFPSINVASTLLNIVTAKTKCRMDLFRLQETHKTEAF